MKKTCGLLCLSTLLALNLAACGGVRQNDGAGGSYDNGNSGDGYYEGGGSLMEDAGDALENGVRDMKDGMDRAGDALERDFRSTGGDSGKNN